MAGLLALAVAGDWSVAGHGGDCALSAPVCAKEGIVILGPRAGRITNWEPSTDFLPIEASSGLAGYTLDHLGSDQSAALVLGRADLAFRRYDQLIRRIFARGGAVVVTHPTLLDAARLDEVAGIRGARWRSFDRARLYGVRMAQAVDGRSHPTTFVLLAEPPGGSGRSLRPRWSRGGSVGLG